MARLKELLALGTTLSLLAGCGAILGLDEYKIDEGDGDGDTPGDGDGDGDGDMAGDGDGDGDGTGGMAMGGSGGSPQSCGGKDCDDDNECTNDSCIDGECAYTTVDTGESCGGGVCNGTTGNPQCVRCVDDASGLRRDSGCDGSAPLCDRSGTPACVECLRHEDCDDANDCTTDTCDSGACQHEEAAAGSSCSGGVCGGEPGEISCVRCIDDASGENQDTGCPAGSPRCEDAGGLTCVGCQNDTDCDDGNECTTESCSQTSECVYQTRAATSTCTGGVCNGTTGGEECVACIDNNSGGNQDSGCTLGQPVCDTAGDNACRVCIDDASVSGIDSGCTAGMPVCDTSAANACVVCVDDAAPGNQDSGCTQQDPFCDGSSCVECEDTMDCTGNLVCAGGSCVQCGTNDDCGGNTPYCNASGSCVECLNAGHCGDSVGCTDDSCSAGTCVNTPNNGNCPDSGDVCNPNICDAVNGCVATPITPTEIELVTDGSMEQRTTYWEEYSTVGELIIVDPINHFTAQSGTYAAWLCGTDNEYSDVYQWVTIPPNATEFTVSGYYRIDFQNNFVSGTQADADDYFIGRFYDKDLTGLGARYIDVNGSVESSDWVYFERTYTDIAAFLPGEEIQFDFWCETDQNPGDTAFFVDNVSIKAKVCEP